MEQWYHDIFKAVCVQRHVYMGDAPPKKKEKDEERDKRGEEGVNMILELEIVQWGF